MEVAGPLGTPLGLAQRKRASPRWEAGISGFLSVSDSDPRVPAELGQESQAWSCLRKGTPLASRVAAAFSSYDGDLSLPLGLALGSPIFPSGCEGKLGVALESLQAEETSPRRVSGT